MTNVVGSWVWILAFFPLWALMACLWFALASFPKRIAGSRVCKALDGAAVALSIGSAAGVLISLNCRNLIHLPFADPACQTANLQFALLNGL
jgi:hypothetical protein